MALSAISLSGRVTAFKLNVWPKERAFAVWGPSDPGFTDSVKLDCGAKAKKLSNFETLARNPAAFVRRHGAVDEIVDPLMAGLTKTKRLVTSQ